MFDAARHANDTTRVFGAFCDVRLYQLLGATYVFLSHEMCERKGRPYMFVADESQFVVTQRLDKSRGLEQTWNFETERCDNCNERFVRDDLRTDGVGRPVCFDCMEQHYHACNSCGGMHHENYMVYVQDQGGTCTGCMPSESEYSD